MASNGAAAEAARVEFRGWLEAKGHAVDNARGAVDGLNAAFDAGVLQKTPVLGAMLADLAVALQADEGQRLGGKSAEAARFIMQAIAGELRNA